MRLNGLRLRPAQRLCFKRILPKATPVKRMALTESLAQAFFARDPDSILTLTKHGVDGAFTVDMTLLQFTAAGAFFFVRWECPVMVKDEELDPKLLKTLKGRPKKCDSSQHGSSRHQKAKADDR